MFMWYVFFLMATISSKKLTMPRTRKSSSNQENQENQESVDLTSKTSRRKRTPSAEMAGMSKSSSSGTPKKRAAGRPKKTESDKTHEYESPEKRRGYERDLTDDYYQEGARYSSPSERGRTEFEYDRRHQSRDPYWGEPREFGRQSHTDPGFESDYRNRRGGSSDYQSDYMSGRGDVPSGGYYGYRRMQEREGDYNYPGYSSGRGRDTDWNRRSDQPYYGSSRQDDRYYGSSRHEPAYGGAWHSDFDDPRPSYNRNFDYDDRGRYSDSYDYRTESSRRGDYESFDRPSRRPGDSWQDWSREEREMMSRREGGYPKNISRNY